MMKTRVLALAAVACLASGIAPAQDRFRDVMLPKPAAVTAGSGALALDSTFAFTPSGDARLDAAVARAIRRVEKATGLPHAGAGNVVVVGKTPLTLKVAAPGGAVQGFEEDESYKLTVTSAGVEIDAATDVGAMHALETMIQLIQAHGDGYVLPAVTVDDKPRFAWRGLMIDCGRHFEPVAVIERTLDGMAAVKLNVFHWHLTEDQGFRMESKVYPKLTGAGSDGLFYSQEQAREVVAYARARGIRVVPEFEMPGHSQAWLYAYPEYASGTVPTDIRREFGVSKFAIDPTRPETYTFIKAFLTEMAGIFPDEYVHIGGDEAPAPDWKTNPKIVAFMKSKGLKDNDAMQAYFNTQILAILKGLNKRMMGWDEVLTPGLPKDVVVQSWRGVASLAKGAKLGYQGVLSAPYYLDAMKPAGVIYLADPIDPAAGLSSEETARVLGGEVTMWAEQLDAHTIDSRIWPRTAAVAERFWSAASVKDVDDMYRRLGPMSVELEGLGLTHLQSGDAGLRELAGTEHISELRRFASALEPVSFGERYKEQKTNQLTALDRFVDAVRPDPSNKHSVEVGINKLIASPTDKANAADLTKYFEELAATVPEVKAQMKGHPRLAEISTRADQMTALTGIAQEAIGYLSEGKKAPAGWKAAATAKLAEAKKPSAVVRFIFLEPLNKLVAAVQE
ncbi:beta-N-acetylhexosaminidase [Granulicella pectinivorans]|nr:family 20 glycosylhydrolase [Granulicella pectinivorans]